MVVIIEADGLFSIREIKALRAAYRSVASPQRRGQGGRPAD
jgi:hypothetical protein